TCPYTSLCRSCMDGALADPAGWVGAVNFRIECHADFFAELGDLGVTQGRVEFGQARTAVQSDKRKHGAHGELGLVHGHWVHYRAQNIDGTLVDMGFDTHDVVCSELVVLHGLQ